MKTAHPPFPSGSVFFTTLCLRHALPESFGQNLGIQYYTAQTRLAAHPDQQNLLHQMRKRLFARYDDALDLEKYGPGCLRDPDLAQTLAEAIHSSSENEVELLAYSILPNHIHLLVHWQDSRLPFLPSDELHSVIWPPLQDFLSNIQTATEAPLKKALQQSGAQAAQFQLRNNRGVIQTDDPCWDAQSFDFLIRDATEFDNALRYLRMNPVKAGLIHWPYVFSKE